MQEEKSSLKKESLKTTNGESIEVVTEKLWAEMTEKLVPEMRKREATGEHKLGILLMATNKTDEEMKEILLKVDENADNWIDVFVGLMQTTENFGSFLLLFMNLIRNKERSRAQAEVTKLMLGSMLGRMK